MQRRAHTADVTAIHPHHEGKKVIIILTIRSEGEKLLLQLAKKMHPPPARGHEDDTRVLGIHSSEDVDPALKGKKKPCVKVNRRTGLGCQQGWKHNYEGDDQTNPLTKLYEPYPLPNFFTCVCR